MNAQLSLYRLWRLIIRQLIENKKMYLATLGVMSLFLCYLGIINQRGHIISGLYPFALALSAALLSANTYKKWSDTGHASTLLMTPASLFEKFITNILTGIFLFVPVFTFLYFLEGFIFSNIFNGPVSWSAILPEISKGDFSISGNPNSLFNSYLLFTLMAFFLIQPLFLLTAARFKRMQFQAGALFIILAFTFAVFCNTILLHNLSHSLAINYTYFFIYEPLGYYDLSLKNAPQMVRVELQPWIYRLNQAIYIGLSVLLYCSAWFSFKEREI
jgi:hypothetical protein